MLSILSRLFHCKSKFWDSSTHGIGKYEHIVKKYGSRCIKPRGHEGPHTDGRCIWSD